MIYALSIDWLSLYCENDTGEICQYVDRYTYEIAPHGTRQFKQLIYVRMDGEDFAEVQQIPCSNVLKSRTLIVKFCNRFLYSRALWYLVSRFLEQNKLRVLNISRIDLCADFNSFHRGLHPISLIKGFLSSTYRHIGRGLGSSHFNHSARKEGKYSRSFLNYTGLSFGTNESASKVYLYNKSFELVAVKDKPYIRQLWQLAGLKNDRDNDVWRLEVSIKSKGMQFTDKKTKAVHKLSTDNLTENQYLSLIYHTFIRSLFSFIRNRDGITNVSREPRLQLFNGEPFLERCVLNQQSAGNRTERILIKQLWQMCDTYRGNDIVEDEGISKLLATNLAQNTNLSEWLADKSRMWNKPTKK